MACLAGALALAGCAGSGSPTGSQAAASAYATQFLGADGSIVTRQSTIMKAREAEAKAFWKGDGVSGSPSIVIDLSAQQASFYRAGQLVGQTPISSGNADNPTPVGSFSVSQKDQDHRSNLYGDYVDGAGQPVVSNVDVNRDRKPAGAQFLGARMPYFMRFSGGAGMHAGFLPGFPDSHGCVRMPDEMAAAFYNAASVGTPVRVVY